MIDQVNGTLLNKKDSYAIIMVGGLGLRVNMSVYGLQTLPNEGGKVQISTYLHVREDILDLYGFSNVVERNTFHLLTSISGIGPKLALTILSGIQPNKLKDRVVNGDVAALTSVQGVGNKTAKRIIAPPISPYIEGLSLTNMKAQMGPSTDSDNIIIPTIAEGVVLAPVVINIKPKPT